jgi:hypothetical protein
MGWSVQEFKNQRQGKKERKKLGNRKDIALVGHVTRQGNCNHE